MGKEKGLKTYKINQSNFMLKKDSKVKKVRPEIVCAVVKNVKLDDYAIKQLIQLQEKLCEGFGRKRKEAALGVYDFDKIKWPITYTAFSPDSLKFIPMPSVPGFPALPLKLEIVLLITWIFETFNKLPPIEEVPVFTKVQFRIDK